MTFLPSASSILILEQRCYPENTLVFGQISVHVSRSCLCLFEGPMLVGTKLQEVACPQGRLNAKEQ